MNAKEFSTDGITPLSVQLKYMCKFPVLFNASSCQADRDASPVSISAGVTAIALALAFSDWIRTALSVALSLMYVSIEDRLGWRNKKNNYNSTAMRNRQRERMKQLESRDRARRLTEIDSRRNTSPRRMPMQQRSTWDVRRIGSRGFFGLRRPASGGRDPV